MKPLLRPQPPPLTPPTLVRGPHTPVKPRRPQHQSIHSAEPLEFIRNTHTHTAETSTSGADWRKVTETRSADALLFSRAVFYIPLCRRCSFITTRAGENGEIIRTWASRIQGLGPSAQHLSFPFSDDCSDETQASLAADVCVCRPFGCRCNSGVRLNMPMGFCPPWAPSLV